MPVVFWLGSVPFLSCFCSNVIRAALHSQQLYSQLKRFTFSSLMCQMSRNSRLLDNDHKATSRVMWTVQWSADFESCTVWTLLMFPQICLTYLPSGCRFSEWLLNLLEPPPLLRLSPRSLSLSLSPLLELRLKVLLSRCSLAEASDREPCMWGSWLPSAEVPLLVVLATAPVLVPMDLEMTLSLWELGL